ncbi:MAG: hypothetical protein M3O50_09500 [Myxococcota bacterium]|nr:hypothetical protein [Myxococcota bacterium]
MPAEPDDMDAHVRSAWRTWLSALATDADAAIAAAMAYESLSSDARRAWLDALEDDAPALRVPPLALYAPLLAVESDDGRRRRIEAAIVAASVPEVARAGETIALHGVARDGTHACMVVAPVYLDFVQVLSCRYTPGGGFVTVRHEPLRHSGDVALEREVDGVAVEPTPLRVVVEDLAHAILADRREQRATPKALESFAHLFAAQPDDGEDADASGT